MNLFISEKIVAKNHVIVLIAGPSCVCFAIESSFSCVVFLRNMLSFFRKQILKLVASK